MDNIIDIINKAELKTIDKETFLSIASMCSFIPKSITENNTWKKLPLSAKEVYRAFKEGRGQKGDPGGTHTGLQYHRSGHCGHPRSEKAPGR